MIRFGSVCSGIEAASIAWGPLGWKAAWLSEIDKAARAVLAHHHPDVPLHGGFTLLRNDAEAFANIDVLVGGTPCQAFSVAGLRQSLADDRGNLTLEYVRLADAIDDVRGRRGQRGLTIVWENVPGVLSTKDNAFGCFLAALVGADAALVPPRGQRWTNSGMVVGPKRAAAWRILDAQYFGLAQRRERVFVVANPRDGDDPSAILFEPEGMRRHSPPCREAGQGIARPIAASPEGGSGYRNDADTADNLVPVAFGGNNTGGAIDIATAVNAHGGPCGRMDFESETFVCHGTQDPDVLRNLAHPLGRNQGQENAVCVHSDALHRSGDALSAGPDAEGRVRLRPPGKGYLSDGTAYSLTAGAPHAVGVTGHTMHALTSEGFDASEDGTGRGNPIVGVDLRNGTVSGGAAMSLQSGGMGGDRGLCINAIPHVVTTGVRRLTPTECERLQGFPYGHTAIPTAKWRRIADDEADYLRAKGIAVERRAGAWHTNAAADGPRYRCLGNSMAVPVMAWIGRRIQAALESLP